MSFQLRGHAGITRCRKSQVVVAAQKRDAPVAIKQRHEKSQLWQGVQTGLLSAAAAIMVAASPVQASDVVKVGTCVLTQCTGALEQCIGDATCLKSLVCLNSCPDGPEETPCQIRCGDLYSDKAIDVFNSCAVSEKKCVPQRVDEGVYPVPPDCALDTKFDLNMFQGRWYITAGLNPLFDQFDCQEHYFAVPNEGTLTAKINWRINKPDGDFFERSTLQRFIQQDNPAMLLNHGNQYLHYEDDWYIIASKPDEYIFIYYRGNNDAWKGYGGATVYTRAASLPKEYIPELKTAAEAAGLDWSQFKLTDNSCPDHPPAPKAPVVVLEEELEDSLKSFGRGFTVVEDEVAQAEQRLQDEIVKELQEADKAFVGFEEELEREERTLAEALGDTFPFLRGVLGGGGSSK